MDKRMLITLLLSIFIALLGVGIVVPVMPVFARELGADHRGILDYGRFAAARGRYPGR